ncbi:MAG TPA: UDP-N-acetylmuramoyl-L-alanyl-D-glutamate--2,6-diaminopimelate ligase [Rhizomicrobium sp.]|jgi:UDP-N-acetylmuramoyl-L-alanyl-D-glutamate--2,6-diaminopimelate ligase
METQSGAIVAVRMADKGPMSEDCAFEGLASDSRAVGPGYLFAALPGTRTDGADFVADAIRRGAVAILGCPPLRAEVEKHGVQFIADENPRRRLAEIAAEHFGAQPRVVAAVTGTNGKTSVCVFLRQLWERRRLRAASIGTIGVVAPSGTAMLAHTTPDAIETQRLLARLACEGVTHVALEASSHGLDQFRLDGVDIAAAAFTNLTRDHLDYHGNFENYFAAKLRLFGELIAPGGLAVVNADAEGVERFVAAAQARDLRLLTVGETGCELRIQSRAPHPEGQSLRIAFAGRTHDVELPIVGAFQASNACVAAGLAIGLGEAPEEIFAALSGLRGAPGRLEKVAVAHRGAAIYVDYAHTPDALESVLTALRPHVAGKLRLVFGCGGDRDRGKRPVMGAIAARLADDAIVTDDNPRSEDAAGIRREILAGCPGATEIGERAEAIRAGVAALAAGDVLVIAGKGHERGQIVGGDTRPFDDSQEARTAARELAP